MTYKNRIALANRWLVPLTLFTLAARTAFEVEDGQFTREYSRLYTALVLGVGLLGLLGVLALLINLLRSKD